MLESSQRRPSITSGGACGCRRCRRLAHWCERWRRRALGFQHGLLGLPWANAAPGVDLLFECRLGPPPGTAPPALRYPRRRPHVPPIHGRPSREARAEAGLFWAPASTQRKRRPGESPAGRRQVIRRNPLSADENRETKTSYHTPTKSAAQVL